MMDNPLNVMTALISLGMLMLGVGYTKRASDAGVAVLAIGVLVMLSSLFYRLYLAFG
ncbi:hypothetical protein KRX52_08855 [Pseudomonas sp. MAP12]|uniref:Uncharacterized protein n=1 Tax=Geopseudomonas aromaticivorans TaxID=2849492 RepID=A0ABS6MVR3_9GAMM|nr:hypothetical protein [Pseudomonas aromaticivorans]MBV2132908.1 hypothetical protein [Pseudomonas aromaticivorans]